MRAHIGKRVVAVNPIVFGEVRIGGETDESTFTRGIARLHRNFQRSALGELVRAGCQYPKFSRAFADQNATIWQHDHFLGIDKALGQNFDFEVSGIGFFSCMEANGKEQG